MVASRPEPDERPDSSPQTQTTPTGANRPRRDVHEAMARYISSICRVRNVWSVSFRTRADLRPVPTCESAGLLIPGDLETRHLTTARVL